MRRPLLHLPRATVFCRRISTTSSPPVIRIKNATFYRRQPSPTDANQHDVNNPPLFPDLTFSVSSDVPSQTHWAIIGPSNAGKTTLLELLRGQHLCFPPSSRSYPYLSTDAIAKKDPRLRYSGTAVQYVGFDNSSARGLSGMGTYMSARYESRREATDFSVRDYLQGRTQLNAQEEEEETGDVALEKVVADLRLERLLSMPLSNLSNGQTRRARIAKALLVNPEVLLLDEPFMGLDPPTTVALSELLGNLARKSDPRVLLALRPQDKIPEWITHLMFLGEDLTITNVGTKAEVAQEVMGVAKTGSAKRLRSYIDFAKSLAEQDLISDSSDDAHTTYVQMVDKPQLGKPVIEMEGVVVKYGEKVVLGKGRQITKGREKKKEGLWWTVRRGQRWGVFGPNGSGKTTLISLITSDHPQSYSLPIRLFSRTRLPSLGRPGISLFELQRRIGHSSPEVHSFFPRHLTVRASLESAFADTPLSRPSILTVAADDRISAFLRWFQGELCPALGPNKILADEAVHLGRERLPHTQPGDPKVWRENHNKYWYEYATEREQEVEWADHMTFRDLSFSAQRVLLFLRAIVAVPDVVVLDESFSGLDETVREKCLLFLEAGELEMLKLVKRKPRSKTPGTGQEGMGSEEADEELEAAMELAQGELKAQPRWKHTARDASFSGLTDEQALIVVSHVKEEIPGSVHDWIFLPDANTDGRVRTGTIKDIPLRSDGAMWETIWGMHEKL